MKLSEALRSEFRSLVRNRGQSYFWQNRVYIASGSNSRVAARVRGSHVYQVALDWKNGGIAGSCECAYFKTEGRCKHLWAVVLAAEDRGYLSDAVFFGSLFRGSGIPGTGQPENIPINSRWRAPSPPPFPGATSRPPAWKSRIDEITGLLSSEGARLVRGWPSKREVVYVVDIGASLEARCLVLQLGSRDRRSDGGWARLRGLGLKLGEVGTLPLPEDREIVAILAGGDEEYGYGYSTGADRVPARHLLPSTLASLVAPRAARTGRLYLRENRDKEELVPVAWDEAGAWQFKLEMLRRPEAAWIVAGILRRGAERMDLETAALITPGLVFTQDRVAPLDEGVPFEWIVQLREYGSIRAPEKDQDELLGALLSMPGLPPLEVPEELGYEEVSTCQPQPRLRVYAGPDRAQGRLRAELSFNYEGEHRVLAHQPVPGFYDAKKRQFLRRDLAREQSARTLLNELGLRFNDWDFGDYRPFWDLTASKLPRVTRTLVEAGWQVEAEGKMLRRASAFHIEVSSGVDWFDLEGGVEYGETRASLPALLQALRRGDNLVRLGDGTFGLMPEDWLKRVGMLAGLGEADGSHIRFRRSQAGFLDALLAAAPEARCDETFVRLREEMRRFQGVEAAAQPAGFVGRLRDYQREGLGWMEFLRRFSFGGCLADDMGVGKTAQVLALFETRRALRAAGGKLGPSLVVVPRSLVFNWKEEAARFTPRLRVLDFTGAARDHSAFADYDVIVTTYGTLRREAATLKDLEFDYVVLDEAQAIKNAGTDSAKAARLLRGAHRLTLSGTPVENHLGELWSLFEFLNPGMLGAASVFKLAGTPARNPSDQTRKLLAQALRPFILRRTKDQVARELPPKTEQTIHCEMKSAQRRLYNELREHYRATLLKRIEVQGLAKSKIQVLEALLRLRQAACHPGLLDPKRRGEPSAKLDTLLKQVGEVVEAGHKALVFSQFTSLLSIVRESLDIEGVVYEYLDGATRDRQARVERFQNDPDCRLFLISLKAGGLGLNLTAAEYVFLLDPWWNPAVEAQAIDRSHRIGQTRQVFAYRLIARDTVEEKVLELQNTKRDLAAAIIGADNSLIRDLGREDLELLLS